MSEPARRRVPYLIAMKGHPATGKSAVAEALARRLHWPLIDKDDAKDNMLDVADANDRAYAIMWQIAEKQLALRLSVIAVSPLAYPAGYARAMVLVEKQHARLLVVETVLEESEWKRRLNARRPGYSTHKISGWEAMQEMLRQYNGCWKYAIAEEHLVQLDTSQPIRRLVAKVVERISGQTEI